MAEKDKKNISVFAGVLDAVNSSRRKKNTIDPSSPNYRHTQTMPTVDTSGGVENMQQQFLDWQVTKIAHDLYTRTVYYDTDRISAYQDFRAMDGTPEISAALNIIRDECLTRGETGDILGIYSENARVKEVLGDLFRNVLNVEFNLRLWIRDLVKYGDYFVMLQIDKEVGIYDFMVLPMEEVHREEGFDGRMDSIRFRWETTGNYFEEWQVAHFRLLEDTRRLPYGRSLLDSSRKLWKQLQLAEDAMLVYRITRAPERRVFYVEVGNLPDADVKTYMGKVQNQIRKQPIVDSRSGKMSYKYNPENVTEDYWIPIRGDKSSRIETLPGACLSLDTKIELLDGRSLALSEIIKEYESGKQLWSYSINPQTGEIVPGKISCAGVTRKNAQVLKITLDNGETMTVTPDHKFPTRFNGEKEAKDLEIGESLWSFNKKFEKIKGAGKKRKRNTYEMIFDHNQKKWVYTHRMVANYFKNLNEHEVFVYSPQYKNENVDLRTIHHKDFDRYNNCPDNLCFMNSSDHYHFHQDSAKNIEKFYGTDKVNEWKENRKIGLQNYFKNLSEEDLNKKRETLKMNSKNCVEGFRTLLQDEGYKKELYEKIKKSLKIVKNKPEYKEKQSNIAKKQWETTNLREISKEKQTIKYSDKMLQFVVNRFKDGLSAEEILKDINAEQSVFMTEFNSLNEGNKQLKKMKYGFTHNNLSKMMQHFGYDNWRDFKNKIECFNHKVVSIEWLEEKIDTGTITIDGDEKYHNFHNFALSCGVFTKNSNLDQIQDIEYLQNKLFAALQVPKTYLNYAEGLQGGSTLSQADLRFARTINSIQEAILLELRRVANIHLYFLGLSDDIDNFTLTLTNPSTQQELLKLETMKARLEVFKEFFTNEATSSASYTWGMENILNFSKSDIKLILKQKKIEKKIFAEIESSVQTYKKIGLFDELDERYEDPEAAAALAAAGGAGGGDEGMGDMGGGGGGGGSSLGGLGGGGLGGLGGGMEAEPGAGAGAEPGGEAGGAPEAGAEEELPISENKIKRRHMIIERKIKQLTDELLGEDDAIAKVMIEKRKENALTKSNKSISNNTKKLIESIDGKFKDSLKMTDYRELDDDGNALLESNKKFLEKNKEIFDQLDVLTSTDGD